MLDPQLPPTTDAPRTGVQDIAQVLESISDAFFALNRSWQFTYLNTAAEQLLARKREDLLGRDVWQEFPQAVGSAFDQQYHRAIAEQVTVEFEEFYAPLTAWFSVRAYPTPAGLSVYFQNVNERRQTEQALRESQQRWQLAVDSANDGIWDWNVLTGSLYWSPRCKAMLGYADAELQISVEVVRELIHPQDREQAWLASGRHLNGETEHYADEYRLLHRDGTYRWILSRGLALRSDSGEPERFVGSHTDITDRKLAEESLRRSHDTFYHLIRDDPFGLYVVDADFRLREVSAGAQKVFENIQPVLGRDFAQVMRAIWQEPFAEDVITRFRHTLETGEPYASPSMVERRNDIPDVEAYDWRIKRIVLPDGRFGVVCYFYDLSERERWERVLRERETQLRTSEERLALAVGAAEVGTFYCPLPLGEIIWNDRCKEHFWLPPEAKVDFDLFYATLHADDRERTRQAIERAVYDREPYDIEYRTVAPDGRERWVRAKGRAYYDAAGNPIRFDGVTLDVTDQRRLQEELHHLAAERQSLLDAERVARREAEHASRMKDEFLTTLSHELRTPLNAILGWSQMLRRGPLDDEDFTQGIATIERNARAQAQIIEDLLDMSRIVSGKVRLEVQRIDLSPIVQAAVDTVKPAAEAKNVRLQVVLDPLAGPVSGDPNRLQQVLWNLLTNAVKFTPKGGRIQVLLERVDSHLEVNVIDSGEGISPEFLPYVFDRFRQADASTTRRHGGLGLGLAIVKQLVELHGGNIRVKSRGVGQGSTFTVLLPILPLPEKLDQTDERRHPLAVGTEMTAAVCAPITGLRILVVDDEPDARVLMKRLLEQCGATVLLAGSGSEATEILRNERPDVLVSDIGMPEEDGYTLMRRVRALASEHGGATPAVALTAYARAEDRMKAVMAGFQHHVAKPVEPAELITMIASLAQNRQI
jgi:PAS domain S-box-containing protein